MKKNRRDRRGGGKPAGPPPGGPTAPRKALTVSMGGFDGLIHQLANIPLLVNRTLPLIESGDHQRANDQLTDALVKVELAKAALLGNLALNALKAGDVGACTGYVDIAIESLTELGLEETELGKMLAIVHANLPGEKPKDGAATGEQGDGSAAAAPVTAEGGDGKSEK